MFRLELIYTASDGAKKELHFFYGDLKVNGKPKITGPFAAGNGTSTTPGWKCSHYAYADSTPKAWLGWKGSNYADGKVYIERTDTSGVATYTDASHAYDQYGNIPYSITTSEPYVAGLGEALIVEQSCPQFGTSSTATFNVTSSFRRVGSSAAVTVSKTFDSSSKAKIPWHRYCDRYKVTLANISTTAAPPIIAYEIYYRRAGQKRD
jgi:hypothetical protein